MKPLITLLLLLPLALAAQQYSLDQLVTHGLEQGWATQRSELSYQASKSQLNSAVWNMLPEVDFGLNIRNDFYHPTTPALPDLSSSAGFSVSKTISLNDPAWFNYRQAALDLQKARLSRESSASAYAYGVFNAYLDVLSVQKQLASLGKNLEIQTRVWEQSKVLNQLGKNTAFDVKEAEIAVMNSRIAIMQLENSISGKRRELFGLVRLDDEGWDLAELEPDATHELPEFSADGVNSLELLRADLRKGELTARQGFLDYFPRVSLAYNFNRSVGGPNFDFDTYTTNHTVSLNLSYSLWNHFKQNQTAKRVKLAQQMVELEIEEKTESLGRQYDALAQELQYLLRLDDLYRDKLAQAAEQIRIAEERFRLGLIEILELDKTRVEFINSEISYNTNRYQILARQEALNNLLSRKIQGKW